MPFINLDRCLPIKEDESSPCLRVKVGFRKQEKFREVTGRRNRGKMKIFKEWSEIYALRRPVLNALIREFSKQGPL